MHVRMYMLIFNGDGVYEHFMILFSIYHLHNITSEYPYNMMRCYFMMLNFKRTVSYFTVLPCMLFLPEMCPCSLQNTCCEHCSLLDE